MSDGQQRRLTVPGVFRNAKPTLDLSGGPSGSVKLPEPLGERDMVFHRSFVDDATLEESIQTVLRINRAATEQGKTLRHDDLVKKRKAARKAVMMILDLSADEVDTITTENQVGIIMHYVVRSQAETMNPLLDGEDED